MNRGFSDLQVDVTAFNQDLSKIKKSVDKKSTPEFLRRLMLALLRDIQMLTPRDTGRAKGGWNPGLRGVVSGRNIRKKDGEYQETAKGKEYIIEATNRVKYILFLEYGHSKQAPQGMVGVTLNRARARLAAGEFNKDFLI